MCVRRVLEGFHLEGAIAARRVHERFFFRALETEGFFVKLTAFIGVLDLTRHLRISSP